MQANLKFARPLAVALGLFALSGTAYAADVVSEEPPAPAPIAELPVASWAGPYAGLNVGYGFSGHTKEKDLGVDNVDVGTKGFVGSVFGGYQWQQENFVYGAEAELGYNGVKGDENGVNSKAGFEGSLRARLGYAVTPEILLYGTGGLAGRSLKVEDDLYGSYRATMLG
ncbi:porin family protein, partial [Mesorhizobium sp. M7A.F.Ca.MR.228.00.0.0]